MKQKKLIGIPVILALTLVTTGCPEEAPEGQTGQNGQTVENVDKLASEPDSGPAPDAPTLNPDIVNPKVENAPTGKYGGNLSLYAYDDPKTFNPTLVVDGTSQRFLAYCFDGLVDEDGVTFEIEPALAESWEIADDQKSYVFKLREGVKWHDGKPFTADDVVFTWMKVLPNPDIPWDSRDVIKVDGKLPIVTKIDAHTVKFELPKPFAPFMRQGVGLTILPKHIFEPWLAKGPNGKVLATSKWGVDADVKTIIGTGPFKFKSYAPGQRLILERNPDYYRVNRHKQPLPYVDTLTVPFMKNLDRAILAFNAGETDQQWLPGKDVAYMKPKEEEGNFKIVNVGPDFRTSYLTFNLNPGKNAQGKPYVTPYKLKWFADTRFRQAISYGLDRQGIIQNVYRQLAVEQNSPIFQKSPFYDPTTPAYSLDREKAMALLTEAGFKLNDGVLKDAEGHEVKFEMLLDTGSKEGELQANMIKQDLKKLGIEVKIQPVTFNVKIARSHETKDWECLMGAWGAGVEPHGVAHLWQSNGQAHIFNLNPSEKPHAKPAYAWEKRIDELFLEGALTLDEGKRKAIYNEFQQIVGKEQPMIFLPVFYYTVALRNSVGNWNPSAYSTLGASWNAYELYKK